MAVKEARKELETIRGRERELRQRLDDLSEEEQDLNSKLGSALASGAPDKEVDALRERRREVREEAEDLANALPFVEKDVRAATRDCRQCELDAAMAEAEGKAAGATEALERVFSAFEEIVGTVGDWQEARASLHTASKVAERHRRSLSEVGDAPNRIPISRDTPLSGAGVLGDTVRTRILRDLEELVDRAVKSRRPEYQS